MRRRRRSDWRALLARIARAIALVAPLAIVLWWYLLREREPEPRPEPTAERPAAEAEEEPAAPPEPAPEVARVGVAAVEERVAERLRETAPSAAPLTGRLRVRLRDVRWRDPDDRTFLRAEAMTGLLDAGAIAGGDVVVSSLVLQAPEFLLVRRAGERDWNYERALAGLLDAGEDDGGAPPRVVLLDVTVRGGRVDVRDRGERYLFTSVSATLPRVLLSGPDRPVPEVRVGRLSAVAELPAADRPVRLVATDGRVRFPGDLVAFEAARATLDGSTFSDVSGTVDPSAPGVGVAMELTGEEVAFADVAFLAPGLPDEGTARFRLSLETVAADRYRLAFRELAARSGASSVAGALSLIAGGDAPTVLIDADLRLDPLEIGLLERFTGPLPYTGTLVGRVTGPAEALAFDVTARLTGEGTDRPFTAGLVGRLSLAADGARLLGLEADLRSVPLAALRPLAPGLPLRGVVTGRVSLRGPPGRTPLELDVQLLVAGGTLFLDGRLDLTGAVAAYDLSGRLIGIELQQLLEPAVPPVALTARFTLVGRGLDPATADARLRLAGRFSGWETEPGDSLRVRAAVAGGVLDLDALRASAGPVRLDARGEWTLRVPSMRGIDYTLAVRALEPLAPYLAILPDTGVSGSVQTRGVLSGTLQRPAFRGELGGDALRWAAWSADSLEAGYTLVLGGAFPEISTDFVATGVEAPDDRAFGRVAGTVRIVEPTFAVDVRAVDADGDAARLAATGRLEADGTRLLRLRDLELDLPERDWTLVGPATIVWTETGTVVRDLELREVDGEGRVAIDGRLPPDEGSDLYVNLAAIPVGDVLRLARRDPELTGLLWGTLRARGAVDGPRVAMDFTLRDGTIRDVPVAAAEGTLRYEDERLDVDATIVLDTVADAARPTRRGLRVDASVPLVLTLGFPPSAELLETAPLSARLVADSVDVAMVAGLTPELRDAQGLLTGEAVVSGTLRRPRLRGQLLLQEGAVTAPELNQRYRDITAQVELEDRRALIRDLRVRSDGWMTATGVVTFEELLRPRLDLTAQLDEFRPVGIEDYEDAALWGEVRITGPLREPLLTGDLFVNDGSIPVPSFDDRIEVEGEAGGVAPLASELPGRPPEEPRPTSWVDALRIEEMIVEAGDNLWFVSEQARVQLQGELVLYKNAAGLRVFGELEGERGTFTLVAGPIVRRFDIVEAQIRFFGTSDPNPAVRVTASRLVIGPNGQEIEIQARVQGTLDAPVLSLATPGGTQIPESELLSFVLFGQPSFALGPEALLLEQPLQGALFGIGGLAELASIELEEALIADVGLPLDVFRIRPPGTLGGFGVPSVVLGRQIADDVFLTVDAGLGTFFGSQTVANPWSVLLEWRIDPEWSLEVGLEPVHRSRLFRGVGSTLATPDLDSQFIAELRRRWTY